jgi:hypothetical protein
MSLNSLLEEEGIKSNETCSEIRALIKRQVELLKAEDLNLIGDDTTLIRMIGFFTDYKKKYDEWKRNQERKDKNRLIAQMVGNDKDGGERERPERKIITKKLKPFYMGGLTEEDEDQEKRARAMREASSRESSFSNRLMKEPNIIRDRSVRGNDKFYEQEVPENVLFVDDASVGGEPSVAGSKYYLTEGSQSVTGKRKITLNLKIPKSKLANLKNIRALIRTRDPKTHALVSKEKTFNLDKVEETVVDEMPKMKYHFKSNFDSGKESVHEKSTDLTSQLPSLGPESRVKVPLRIEKMEFAPRPNHLPNFSSRQS